MAAFYARARRTLNKRLVQWSQVENVHATHKPQLTESSVSENAWLLVRSSRLAFLPRSSLKTDVCWTHLFCNVPCDYRLGPIRI